MRLSYLNSFYPEYRYESLEKYVIKELARRKFDLDREIMLRRFLFPLIYKNIKYESKGNPLDICFLTHTVAVTIIMRSTEVRC